MLGSLPAVYCQENRGAEEQKYAPAAGDLAGTVMFGRGNFLNWGIEYMMPSAPGADASWTVPGTAPYNNTVDANHNETSNIVGVELKYFLTDKFAIRASGGGIVRHTPARTNVPGFINADAPNATWIPAYASVESDNSVEANFSLGGEIQFTSQSNRLFPYVGIAIPFYYSRKSLYDPTIIAVEEGMGLTDPVVDVGMRHVEIVGMGGQFVAGVDFYLLEGLFFGIEVKPASYVYAFNTKVAAPGLEAGQADNHSFSFFSQTFLKLGFRF